MQRHDPFVAAADRWLVETATADGELPAFTDLSATAGPHARRTLYLHALACILGAPDADARRLLADTEAALGGERSSRLKPWQRIMLLSFEAIACSASGLPVPAGTLGEVQRAQSSDGSFLGMPLVTGMLHLALTRTAPDHPATHRCRESLLADQQPDGTWRFLVSEVWDTALMVRALRAECHHEAVIEGRRDRLTSIIPPQMPECYLQPRSAEDSGTLADQLSRRAGSSTSILRTGDEGRAAR
ncbi:hypothetical protein [Kitasatospora sp. NPDC097643]|uniref:hypothetical protein n=1 Tax=Kitasatospora sp. NPDC097643 TaxID=3157230 RepID=UPI0033284916